MGNGDPPAGPSEWIRQEAVLWRRLIDGAVLLPPGADTLLALNESATLVWEILAEPATTAEVVELIQEAFGLPGDEARAAIGPLIQHLADAGALERV